MGEDLSAGAKIAIILVLLCAIVASVFSIMTIVKNMTNQSVDSLQSSLYAFQNMRWDDYNLTTVSGNQVQVLIRQAVEEEIAVVVQTQRAGGAGYATLYGTPLNGFTQYKTPGGNSTLQFYVCEDVNGTRDEPTDGADSTSFYEDAKTSKMIASLMVDSATENKGVGSYTRNITDKSSMFYIDPMLKYYATHITDSSGTLLGVWFQQKPVNA